MIRRETKLILLLACLLMQACSANRFPEQPDLPRSVSPSWTRNTFGAGSLPAGVPAAVKAECWKAAYANTSNGSAEVWVCGYAHGGSAFDALQRAGTTANTVKFQEGDRLAIVKWNGASRDEIKALVLAIQRSIR